MSNDQNKFDELRATDKHSYSRLVLRAGVASTLTAGMLIMAKLFAFVLTGSSTILASLTDSMMDILASLVNLLAIRYSILPADSGHRYGHWKAESLSGLAQSLFITVSAIFLISHGVSRFMHPVAIDHIEAGVWVTLFALVVTFALFCYQTYVVRRTNSTAVRADRLHYASDILFNIGVLLSLIMSMFGVVKADGLFAGILGVYIFWGAFKIGRDSTSILMDAQIPVKDTKRIAELLKVCGVHGVHDIRARRAGASIFIQAHLEIDGTVSLNAAHALTEKAEQSVLREYHNADITLHMEPFDINGTLCKKAKKCIKNG